MTSTRKYTKQQLINLLKHKEETIKKKNKEILKLNEDIINHQKEEIELYKKLDKATFLTDLLKIHLENFNN